MDKEFLDELDQLVKDLEQSIEFRNDFEKELTEEVCKTFLELNTDYDISLEELAALAHKDAGWLAYELCENFINLYHHYKESTEPFIANFDPTVNYRKPEMSQEEIDEYHRLFDSKATPERFQEIIDENNKDLAEAANYEKVFHHTIKKYISQFLEDDIDHLTSTAFKEINYLTWIAYLEFDEELHDILYKRKKEKEEKESISDEKL